MKYLKLAAPEKQDKNKNLRTVNDVAGIKLWRLIPNRNFPPSSPGLSWVLWTGSLRQMGWGPLMYASELMKQQEKWQELRAEACLVRFDDHLRCVCVCATVPVYKFVCEKQEVCLPVPLLPSSSKTYIIFNTKSWEKAAKFKISDTGAARLVDESINGKLTSNNFDNWFIVLSHV